MKHTSSYCYLLESTPYPASVSYPTSEANELLSRACAGLASTVYGFEELELASKYGVKAELHRNALYEISLELTTQRSHLGFIIQTYTSSLCIRFRCLQENLIRFVSSKVHTSEYITVAGLIT